MAREIKSWHQQLEEISMNLFGKHTEAYEERHKKYIEKKNAEKKHEKAAVESK